MGHWKNPVYIWYWLKCKMFALIRDWCPFPILSESVCGSFPSLFAYKCESDSYRRTDYFSNVKLNIYFSQSQRIWYNMRSIIFSWVNKVIMIIFYMVVIFLMFFPSYRQHYCFTAAHTYSERFLHPNNQCAFKNINRFPSTNMSTIRTIDDLSQFVHKILW